MQQNDGKLHVVETDQLGVRKGVSERQQSVSIVITHRAADFRITGVDRLSRIDEQAKTALTSSGFDTTQHKGEKIATYRWKQQSQRVGFPTSKRLSCGVRAVTQRGNSRSDLGFSRRCH
jgi:hypothetical protein